MEICRAALVEGHAHARAGNPRGLGSKPLDRFHIELGGGSHRERQSDATLRGSFRTRPNGRLGSRPTSSTFPGREISRSTRMGASLSSAPGFGAGSAIPILGHLGCSFSAEGSSRPSMPLQRDLHQERDQDQPLRSAPLRDSYSSSQRRPEGPPPGGPSYFPPLNLPLPALRAARRRFQPRFSVQRTA